MEELTGLTTEDYIAFYQLVCDSFSNAIDSSKKAVDNIKIFLNSINPYSVDIEKEYQWMLDFGREQVGTDFENAMDSLNTIKAAVITEMFGEEKGKTSMTTFGLYREARDFAFYNGKNPFAEQPLCWIDEEVLFIVHPQFVLNSIYNYITEVLEKP